MLKAPATFYGSADAHTRRVTLTLIRASTRCPDDLVFIVDSLAGAGWDWSTLTQADAEAVYGLVNDDLVEQAKSEFSADTTTVVDLARHLADHPEFVDDDGDTFCPLCGHKHLRWGFTLQNTVKADQGITEGRDLLTGSTCVVQYGLRVDGTMTAEAALEALNKAIAGLMRKAEREDWQKEHPDHRRELAIVAHAEDRIGKRWFSFVNAEARRMLPYPWGSHRNREHAAYAKWARATVKYYATHGYLTAERSEQLYASGGLEQARRIVTAVAEANDASPTYRDWMDWLARHPGITEGERRRLDDIIARSYPRDRLYNFNRQLVDDIEARHRADRLPPPPPLPGGDIVTPPAPAPKPPGPTLDDVSDLPGMV